MENLQLSSNTLNELFTALAKAQSEMLIAGENSTGGSSQSYKFKYADFTEIVKASRPALTKNGLCVIQRTIYNDNQSFLETLLCHSGGQYISSAMPITPKGNDPKDLGGYITYLKRYTYSAIVGVISHEEEDIDKYQETKKQSKLISQSQVDTLITEFKKSPGLLQKFLDNKSIASLHNLPADKFDETLKLIQNYTNSKKD